MLSSSSKKMFRKLSTTRSPPIHFDPINETWPNLDRRFGGVVSTRSKSYYDSIEKSIIYSDIEFKKLNINKKMQKTMVQNLFIFSLGVQ